jgi:GAF domain-containing protein
VTRELREGYLEPLGITSMLDAPIYFAGQVRGVVCHEHVGKPRAWSNEDCDFAGSVADRLALLGEEAARRDAEHRVLALGEQALDTESMKAVAQLAAGAAHDVRSMVSVVRWAGETIANASPSNGVVTENVGRIMSVTESIMTLARNLETLGPGRGRTRLKS